MAIDGLIKKFLQGLCTPEEARVVEQYFLDHPAEMDRLLDEREWTETSAEGRLEEPLERVMLENIRRRAYEGQAEGMGHRRNGVIRMLGWAAAVASVVVGLGVLLWPAGRQNGGRGRDVAASDGRGAVKETREWVTRTSTAAGNMRVVLDDGSVVLLSANSTVRYREPFEDSVREVVLDGEAIFDVTKDQARPFEVRSGMFRTTVLGTSFKITAFRGAARGIDVRLITGRVMVGVSDSVKPRGWKGNITLSAGERLQYESEAGALAVTHWRESDGQQAGGGTVREKERTVREENGVMTFDNAPFREVVVLLRKKYGIAIDFDPAETSNIYFSGTISMADSLDIVLRAIARMNGLEVAKQEGGYSVRRYRR